MYKFTLILSLILVNCSFAQDWVWKDKFSDKTRICHFDSRFVSNEKIEIKNFVVDNKLVLNKSLFRYFIKNAISGKLFIPIKNIIEKSAVVNTNKNGQIVAVSFEGYEFSGNCYHPNFLY